MTIRALFPGRILARISILPKISRIWLCLCVQTDRCMTSVPYVFEMFSRYFESKQYRNPGQDASRKNGTHGHPTRALSKDFGLGSFLASMYSKTPQQQCSNALATTKNTLSLCWQASFAPKKSQIVHINQVNFIFITYDNRLRYFSYAYCNQLTVRLLNHIKMPY